MDFHLLLQAFAALSFTVSFDVSNEHTQDFFIFQGNNCQAHLFRQGDVLNLYLNQNNVFTIYQLENMTNIFSFSWPGFFVNNVEMYTSHTDKDLDVEYFNFTEFTFISPLLEMYDYEFEPLLQTLSNTTNLNYGYLVLIMIAVVLSLKADARTVKEFINAMKKIKKLDPDDVSMRSIEIDEPNIVQDNG